MRFINRIGRRPARRNIFGAGDFVKGSDLGFCMVLVAGSP